LDFSITGVDYEVGIIHGRKGTWQQFE